MSEPTYLELRGALVLLRNAKRVLRMSGWEGTSYHNATPAAKEAWNILETAAFAVSREIRWITGTTKEALQSVALGEIR